MVAANHMSHGSIASEAARNHAIEMELAPPVAVQKTILCRAEIVQSGIYVLSVLHQASNAPIDLLLGDGAELDLLVEYAQEALAVTGIERIHGLAHNLDILLGHLPPTIRARRSQLTALFRSAPIFFSSA